MPAAHVPRPWRTGCAALQGKVVVTVSRGRVVWEGGRLHVSPGTGRFIPLPTHGPLYQVGGRVGARSLLGGSEGGGTRLLVLGSMVLARALCGCGAAAACAAHLSLGLTMADGDLLKRPAWLLLLLPDLMTNYYLILSVELIF